MWLTFFGDNFWSNLLTIGNETSVGSVAEKIIRPVLVYVFLVAALRVFGKRELAQLNPFDLIVLLMLSNTVQNAIIGSDISVSGGIIGAVTLLSFNYIVVRFLFKHQTLDKIIEGSRAKLIENGIINHKVLARELITVSELLAVIHRQGFRKLKDIENCVLDENGTFYVEAKKTTELDEKHDQILSEIKELRLQITNLEQKIL